MSTQLTPMTGRVDARGFYHADPGYQQMENARSVRVDPSVVPSGVVVPEVSLIVPPQGAARWDVIFVGLNLLLGASPMLADSSQRMSWTLTALNLLFPGIVARFMATYITAVEVVMTEAQWEFWSHGRIHDGTQYVEPTPGTIGAINARSNEFTPAEYPPTTRSSLPDFTDLDLAAAYGMLLYSITKTPNAQNQIGFTERRPRAAANSIHRDQIVQEFVPRLALYTSFSAVMVGSPALRIGVARVMAGWAASNNIGMLQGVVIAQVRIWRDHQLTSFKEVMAMVTRYGPVLDEVRFLAQDLENYRNHLQRYLECARGVRDGTRVVLEADPLVDYRNAIYGPLSDIKPIRPYPNLTMLMRDYKRIGAANQEERARWNNFAPNVAQDLSYEDDLQAAATRLGVTIPNRRA